MSRNPFIGDANQPPAVRFQLVQHNPRPTKYHPAFQNLSAEALAIAQEWHDDAVADQKQAAQVAERARAYFAENGGVLVADIKL